MVLKRLNVYLAERAYSTRRGADELIRKGLVYVNGTRAVVGQKVSETDTVDVRSARRAYRYFAYNKPRGVITHSPQMGERDIAASVPLENVFPVGRLDKDSHGLILLTDDGRLTERLLSPDNEHEKEYRVQTRQKLRPSFSTHMEHGVDIGGYTTRRCKIKILGEKLFSIVLTEGKKHQIRRMCSTLHVDIEDLQRIRIMHVRLGDMKPGEYRDLKGEELRQLLKDVQLA